MLDPVCLKLAKYLQEWLNSELKKIDPNLVACRDTVCYDAVNPDLSRFPLLKVYRLSDNFEYGHPKSQTSFVISYCLSFPDQELLPGILRWVSWQLNEALTQWKESKNCSPIITQGSFRSEYRIMVNELSQPVYAFLRFSFTGIDYLEA